MENFDQFKFDPRSLSTPRKPGISAYMRVKNGGEFVRLSVLSHLDYYDEIIACYNDCSDDTETILLDLAKQHPQKIKVHHYLPKVHLLSSEEHKQTPAHSVHSMANYYNYALSKTTFNVAVKLDDDHLSIPQNIVPMIKIIRADIARGKQKLYTFSGINLIRETHSIKVAGRRDYLFSGNGEIMYHPVSEKIYYRQGETTEKFNHPSRKLMETQYMGIMYFHLKYLKKHFGLVNRSEKAKAIHLQKLNKEGWIVSFAEFCSWRHHKMLLKQLKWRNRFRYALYRHRAIRQLKYKMTGQHPHLKVMRLIRLAEDLKHIDFERDVLGKFGYKLG